MVLQPDAKNTCSLYTKRFNLSIKRTFYAETATQLYVIKKIEKLLSEKTENSLIQS
jgi:hypothetical protein